MCVCMNVNAIQLMVKILPTSKIRQQRTCMDGEPPWVDFVQTELYKINSVCSVPNYTYVFGGEVLFARKQFQLAIRHYIQEPEAFSSMQLALWETQEPYHNIWLTFYVTLHKMRDMSFETNVQNLQLTQKAATVEKV